MVLNSSDFGFMCFEICFLNMAGLIFMCFFLQVAIQFGVLLLDRAVGRFVAVRASLLQGRIWAHPGVSGCIWVYLADLSASGCIWAHLSVSGGTSVYLGVFGHIWVYLGASWCIWAHLGASGVSRRA